MSWDVSLDYGLCDACGQHGSVEVRNITYNNSKIFSELGVHPNDLEGKLGMQIADICQKALERSYEIESELKKIEPDNGWGGLEDSRNFIQTLHRKCLDHPKARFHSS